jgi:hypothetical protein
MPRRIQLHIPRMIHCRAANNTFLYKPDDKRVNLPNICYKWREEGAHDSEPRHEWSRITPKLGLDSKETESTWTNVPTLMSLEGVSKKKAGF